MNNGFINTENVTRAPELCDEVAGPDGLIGPSLAMITGDAGRGKTEWARHFATNSNAVYLPPLNIRTPTMLLREIAFEVGEVRPARSETCLEVISERLGRDRCLIIIDEADLLDMRVLEMLRNLNERLACPVLLIGEDKLKTKVRSRRRISSRIRRHIAFGPVDQSDVALFFRKALEMNIGPAETATIVVYAGGDWRDVLSVAIALERAVNATNKPPDKGMIDAVIASM